MITWGENLHSEVVRVSKAGEPESFNEIEGFITVNPGDSGGGVKNCAEYRNQLIICKSMRTYYTQDREGLEAAFWEVGSVDMSIGTECHGFGRSLDFGENVQDILIIADRAGLRLFNGSFSDENVLSWNIDDIWSRITKSAFHTIQVAIDPVENRIYVAVPLDGALAPTVLLYADYSEGISAENIRWTPWIFPRATQSVVVDVIDSVTVMKFGAPNGNVYAMDTTVELDFNNAIESWIEFPYFPEGEIDDVINHFTGVRLRVRGQGILLITGKGLDAVNTFQAQSLVLSLSPGRAFFKGFNFVGERCSVKLRMESTNEFFKLTKMSLYVSPLWEQRAS